MLKSYLRSAFRNLYRNKLYTAVSVAGLALGLAVCLLAVRYIMYEYSFDNIKDKGRVYEVIFRAKTLSGFQDFSATPFHLGDVLHQNFPHIESATQFSIYPMAIRRGIQPAVSAGICQADSNTFKMFDFKMIEGNPSTCLKDMQSVVLTEEGARRLYGSLQVVGKTVRIETNFNEWKVFTVTGIMKDTPATSSLSFSAVIPIQFNPAFDATSGASWHTLSGCCFIKLEPNTDPAKLAALFPGFIASIGGDTSHVTLRLIPMKRVHFATEVQTQLKTYDAKYLYIFSAIAVLVLAVSLFNFIGINLTVFSRRAKEVGVRKVVGASRRNLISQFLVENALLMIVSLLGAVCLSELLLPFSNSVLNVPLKLDYIGDDVSLLVVLGIVAIILLFSTIYVTYLLSSIDAHSLIQQKLIKLNVGGNVRSWSIFLQFAIAAFLVASTAVGLRQLYFVAHKNLGFDRNDVILIDNRSVGVGDRADILRHELEQDPDIISVSASNWFPSMSTEFTVDASPVGKPDEKTELSIVWADRNLLPTLGMKLVSGRNFNPAVPSDTNSLILNEQAARQLGKATEITVGERPVSEGIQFADNDVRVIGVVKDFNYQSLRQDVRPFAIQFVKEYWPFLGVKYRKHTAKQVVAYIQEVWRKTNPGHPLQYQFLSDAINKEYLSDDRMFEAFAAGSVAAILVALMGIFALSFFLIETRTKEIAIRKVLGASVGGIINLLSRDFLKLIIVANIVAWPVAYWIMQSWLQTFTYRTGIEVLIFPMVGLGMVGLGLLTVLAQALTAATANPVESLRYE